MPRLEDTQVASREVTSRGDNLTQQASNLLNERSALQKGGGHEPSNGSLSFDTDLYGSTEKAGSCKADGACSWKPDANSHSKKTEQWKSDREVQRSKPLELDDQDRYEVKRGDTMNDIAKRYFKEQGIEPTNKDVEKLSKAIADANKDNYAILKCNPNLIRPGMKLDMPPADKLDGIVGQRPVYGAQSPDFGMTEGSGSGDGSRIRIPDESAITNRHENRIGGPLVNPANSQENAITNDGGLMNLPGGFCSPRDLLNDLDLPGMIKKYSLPNEYSKPGQVEHHDLVYRPFEDRGGKFMNIPFNPKDGAGIMMNVPFKFEDTSLPKVMFV